MDARAVELAQLGTVEHYTRPLAIQARLKITKKKMALLNTQLLWQLLHRY
jgi:hypothetical protein